eukprot:7897382-Ditylum_brightwellii.AAC.1
MGLGKYDYAIQRKQDPKKGKPCLLDAKNCLGLILMWTHARGPTWVLGVMCILLFVLQQEEQIHPHMPTQQELESFFNVIGKKYNILAKKK